MDKVRWQVTDPLGNEIRLSEENFRYHIMEMHEEKDAEARKKIEEHVKYSLQNPRFIVKDKNIAGRKVYLDLVNVIGNEDLISIRSLSVVVDTSGEVVTWFAQRTINIKIQTEGGIIYDKRVRDLQVQLKI